MMFQKTDNPLKLTKIDLPKKITLDDILRRIDVVPKKNKKNRGLNSGIK